MSNPNRSLPARIEPMLAARSEPFDSDDYSFEIKWDGFRAIARVDAAGELTLVSRRHRPLLPRFPELAVLSAFPPGTILDGEVVALDSHGRPDFEALLSRSESASSATRSGAVSFVAFDLLFDRYEDLTRQSLQERRERLESRLGAVTAEVTDRVAFSDGVVGAGIEFFEQICDRGLEGVVAKDLRSRYSPGKRSNAWLKIKRRRRMNCVILGFCAEGRDLRTLVIATDTDGVLTCVGRVGSGLGATVRERLLSRLQAAICDAPLIDCSQAEAGASLPVRWVRPELFCIVQYLERTSSGALRAPVFENLIE